MVSGRNILVLVVVAIVLTLLRGWMKSVMKGGGHKPAGGAGSASAAEALQGLAASLRPPAGQAVDPRGLGERPEFQRAAAWFADPKVELRMVRKYALGENQILSCAAFDALGNRADRQDLLPLVQTRLRGFGPVVLPFVLRYLEGLPTRPPVGAPAAVATSAWAGDNGLLESFEAYFAAREALGDEPTFGDVKPKGGIDAAPVEAFLGAIEHPFAAALIAELHAARDRTGPAGAPDAAWPSVDIEETDAGYRVTAELAGVDQADVHVSFKDGVLTIRGEKRGGAPDDAQTVNERRFGRFVRRLPLAGADDAEAKATFANGVLTVDLPRSASAGPPARRIPINGGGEAP